MRTIKNLISNEKRVYIFMRDRATRFRFMSDAEREGITYFDHSSPTERMVSDIMSLNPDNTICFVGAMGRTCFQCNPPYIIRIDYEKYVNGDDNYMFR